MVTTDLKSRSRGFVWFFSFLAYFSRWQKSDPSLVLLLDEPGLFLHASAQGDLLRYIEEELKPTHQVLYTTHSPFLVDATRFDRVRIVEDTSLAADGSPADPNAGTKVLADVLAASAGTLFPLQHALGYQIAQTLFIGPSSLIVEGVSDLLYIQTLSEILKTTGRPGLDQRWTITPVGGAEKVPTFVSLIGSQPSMTLATLIDVDKASRQRVENLYREKLMKRHNVRTFAEFVGRDEADIEDMFDVSFYIELVNREFATSLLAPISEADLPPGSRVVQRLEAHFRSHPLRGGAFSHYRPARYMAENAGELRAMISAAALDRFERAFRTINDLQ